jgi:hypothetical protein
MNDIEELIGKVIVSFLKANNHESKINKEILKMENGGSSSKVRHFLNNLCSYSGTKYFEVGTSFGSTMMSAMSNNYKNSIKSSLSMDVWFEKTQEKIAKRSFFENSKNFLGITPDENWQLNCESNFCHIDGDCWNHDISKINEKYNVYFYDGAHQKDDQRKAITSFNDILENKFIMIIDDWNDRNVQEGTSLGFKESNLIVHFNQYLPANPGSTPPAFGDLNEWFNGLMVFVCEKT